MLKTFMVGEAKCDQVLARLVRRGELDLARVEPQVREIVDRVRQEGDAALREFTSKFDGREFRGVTNGWRGKASQVRCHTELAEAASRIERYHQHQVENGFRYEERGIELGMRVRPLRSVAVYAPGGKARYPSTVLMAAIPARVAGVSRIVLATPSLTDEVLAAAELAGVTEVIEMGGAQAIAALAYGTESVAPVDKIVGPGNIYVACAKRLVYGHVDIDSIAGPSEVLVVGDEAANPAWVAADLLAQAEHDEAAYPLLVGLSHLWVTQVEESLREQLDDLPRADIARASLRQNGYAFVAGDLQEAARVADQLAPEHLCLSVADPDAFLDRVHAVGAAFLGRHTPETAGDYAAGPSHVLPTGGAARHASPLGVYDFVVRTSLMRYSAAALGEQADLLEALAKLEGLDGHARAVAIRR